MCAVFGYIIVRNNGSYLTKAVSIDFCLEFECSFEILTQCHYNRSNVFVWNVDFFSVLWIRYFQTNKIITTNFVLRFRCLGMIPGCPHLQVGTITCSIGTNDASAPTVL